MHYGKPERVQETGPQEIRAASGAFAGVGFAGLGCGGGVRGVGTGGSGGAAGSGGPGGGADYGAGGSSAGGSGHPGDAGTGGRRAGRYGDAGGASISRAYRRPRAHSDSGTAGGQRAGSADLYYRRGTDHHRGGERQLRRQYPEHHMRRFGERPADLD